MSKKLVAVIIVAIVLLLGISGYVFISNNKDESKESNSSSKTTTSTSKKATDSSGNVFSLSESGKAQTCKFTYTGTSGTGTGNMYSDGRGRAIMTLVVNTSKGSSLTSNTLLLGDKVYSWTITGGNAVGFVANKSTYTAPKTNTASEVSSNTSSTSQNSDISKSYKIKCSSWKVDDSVLAVPTSVNFQTLPSSTPQ